MAQDHGTCSGSSPATAVHLGTAIPPQTSGDDEEPSVQSPLEALHVYGGRNKAVLFNLEMIGTVFGVLMEQLIQK